MEFGAPSLCQANTVLSSYLQNTQKDKQQSFHTIFRDYSMDEKSNTCPQMSFSNTVWLTLIETVPVEGIQSIVIFLLLTLTMLLWSELPYVLPLYCRTLYSEMHLPPSLGVSHSKTLQEDRRILVTIPETNIAK